MKTNYDVAAYIWPAYSGDDLRSRIFWEEGFGEWQSVKKSAKKFEGHLWPRKPLWGYVNEADPRVMEMQIDAAADHGVNVFIYDWYWYDRMPFLETCLNDGYLNARNNDRVKFYLMWANHDVNLTWDLRNSDPFYDTLLWKGCVDRKEFEIIGDRLINKYFHLPNYYKIDGKPVFQIYDLNNLIKGLGGVEETNSALLWLNEECIKNGLAGVYIMNTMWSESFLNLSGIDGNRTNNVKSLFEKMGFNGITHYQFCHFVDIDRDYGEILIDVEKEWAHIDSSYDIPYYPHISVGWDNNPRFMGKIDGVVKNNTPKAIENGLRRAKEFVDAHQNQAPLITINSWNEWTETSYLQPDDLYGYGYLEAIKSVFKDEK